VTALAQRWRDRLPLDDGEELVTLGEGGTPLLHAPRLSERLGLDVWLKWEGANPTGSFKDRGMCVAVTKARSAGAKAVVCASTGNTAASAAAYATRAGLRAVVLEPEGAVALGKLAQARALGARILAVRGSFEQALAAAGELADRRDYGFVNSLNPYRIEGQKTAAFEIAEALGGPPDALALPYGGGGNTRAYAKGFDEWDEGLPRLISGAAADRAGTFASAIRITGPAHAAEAEAAVVRSGGIVVELTDDEIATAWKLLLQTEGIFCEPASAAGIAALPHAELPRGSRVVCVLTGNGMKDPDSVGRLGADPVVVDPDPDAIAEAAGA
jgi:threonine synthase